MFKGKGKHRKPRARWVGPVMAVEGILLAFEGKREMEAASAAQLAGMART